MTIDKFKKTNKPAKRTSALKSYKDEILKLYDDNYSVTQIQEFLKTNGVETTGRNIYYFIKKEKETNNESAWKFYAKK